MSIAGSRARTLFLLLVLSALGAWSCAGGSPPHAYLHEKESPPPAAWSYAGDTGPAHWGDLCEEDRILNEKSLRDGSRLLSAYSTSRGTKLWVITEAADLLGRRSATTILLPEEY